MAKLGRSPASRFLTRHGASNWHPTHRAIAVALLLAGIVLAVTARTGEVFDDPWILYRYASNLVAGHGWTFNPGEQSENAVTSPLTVLLLAGLVATGMAVGTAAALIFMLGMWATGWFVFLALRAMRLEVGGVVAALLLVTSPALISLRGMESALALGLLSLGAFLAVAGRAGASGAVFGLAILARPDSAVLVLVLFVVSAMVSWRRAVWALAGALAVLGSWLLFAPILGADPVPSTLAAKVAQADSGLWLPFPEGLLQSLLSGQTLIGLTVVLVSSVVATWLFMRSGNLVILAIWLGGMAVVLPAAGLLSSPIGSSARLGLLLSLATAGLTYIVVVRQQALLAFVVGVICIVNALSILGVADYPWYSALPVYCGLILAGVGVEALIRSTRGDGRAYVAAGLAGGIMLTSALGLALGIPSMSQDRVEYATVASWLRGHTAADASVAAIEIGRLGFLSERPIIDYVGLLDDRANQHLRSQHWDWWVYEYEPDFVVIHTYVQWPVESSVQNEPWFADVYRLAFRTPTLELYERVAEIPPAAGPRRAAE